MTVDRYNRQREFTIFLFANVFFSLLFYNQAKLIINLDHKHNTNKRTCELARNKIKLKLDDRKWPFAFGNFHLLLHYIYDCIDVLFRVFHSFYLVHIVYMSNLKQYSLYIKHRYTSHFHFKL